MSTAKNIIENLENQIGVPNAFNSESIDTNEEIYASIEGLSPEESALAIKTLEKEDKEEHENDEDELELEDDSNIPEGYDDNGFIN